MSHRKAVPVIPFDYELDTTSLEYVKHQFKTRAADGSEDTIEDRIPKLREDASPFEILQFLSTFQRVRRTMGWTKVSPEVPYAPHWVPPGYLGAAHDWSKPYCQQL